jgi:hypothetical protein
MRKRSGTKVPSTRHHTVFVNFRQCLGRNRMNCWKKRPKNVSKSITRRESTANKTCDSVTGSAEMEFMQKPLHCKRIFLVCHAKCNQNSSIPVTGNCHTRVYIQTLYKVLNYVSTVCVCSEKYLQLWINFIKATVNHDRQCLTWLQCLMF